jgi:hypothetical protein
MMSDLWDDPPAVQPPPVRPYDPQDSLGPIFPAVYNGECPMCWSTIFPGDQIRAMSTGAFIHADDYCEDLATREMR